MKNLYRTLVFFGVILSLIGGVKAGNDNRRSTSGAAQLSVNPWARSTGWGGVNTANGRGLDALYTNVAGILFLEEGDTNTANRSTEVRYANTILFPGSGLSLNAAGFVHMINSSNAISLSFMSIGGGSIEKITEESPEYGKNGTFRTTNMNINVAYAHAFSTSIYGGANVKLVNEGTDEVSAMAIAVDAGIQYITGENQEVKFGISLKNIGSKMSFSGPATSKMVDGDEYQYTMEETAQSIELPTRLNIGASYDFLFAEQNRLTVAGNFSSNAFSRDQFILGAELGLFKLFQLRSGYVFEKDIFNTDKKATAFSGLTAGFSIDAPLGKPKKGIYTPVITLDYAYRLTTNLGGCHTIGLGINL